MNYHRKAGDGAIFVYDCKSDALVGCADYVWKIKDFLLTLP